MTGRHLQEPPGVFSSRKSTAAFVVAAVALGAEIALHIAGADLLSRMLLLAVGGVAVLTLMVLMRRQRAPSVASHGETVGRAAKVWLGEALVVWTAAIVLALAGAAVGTWVGFLFAGCVFGALAAYYLWRAY